MCYKKSFITQFFEIVSSSEMQVEFHFKTRICFLRENWCLPPIGVMQFCIESQVLVQQRGINSESK